MLPGYGERLRSTWLVTEGCPRRGSLVEKYLFTIAELCNQINMGLTKTTELVRTGEIASVRIGRSVRIPAHAVAEFVRRLEEQQR